MPMIYADEDAAASVMGTDTWHGTYAQAMADYIQTGSRRPPRRPRRHASRLSIGPDNSGQDMYMAPSPQMGRRLGLLYQAGMGQLYQAGLGQVDQTIADFKRWSGILDQYYENYAVRIDNDAKRNSLIGTYHILAPQRDALMNKISKGTPGAADLVAMVRLNGYMQRYRDSVGKARDQYGLMDHPAPDAPVKGGKDNTLLYAAGALVLAVGAWAAFS